MISLLSYITGQERQLVGSGDFEYSLVSGIGDTDLRTYNFDLGIIKEHKKTQFGCSLGYSNHQFAYFEKLTGFDESSFEKLHTVSAEFHYAQALGKNWSTIIALTPTLSSNFWKGIGSEDFIPSGSLALSKLWSGDNKTSRLTLGAAYGTIFGTPQWYPILSFAQSFNKNWAYTLGLPESWITYSLNGGHNLKARVSWFGTYANNSQTMTSAAIGALSDTKLRFNGSDIGLEHNYDMGTGFTTVVRAGFQQTDNLEVLDMEGVKIHDFEPSDTLYISMGLKYKLN